MNSIMEAFRSIGLFFSFNSFLEFIKNQASCLANHIKKLGLFSHYISRFFELFHNANSPCQELIEYEDIDVIDGDFRELYNEQFHSTYRLLKDGACAQDYKIMLQIGLLYKSVLSLQYIYQEAVIKKKEISWCFSSINKEDLESSHKKILKCILNIEKFLTYPDGIVNRICNDFTIERDFFPAEELLNFKNTWKTCQEKFFESCLCLFSEVVKYINEDIDKAYDDIAKLNRESPDDDRSMAAKGLDHLVSKVDLIENLLDSRFPKTLIKEKGSYLKLCALDIIEHITDSRQIIESLI